MFCSFDNCAVATFCKWFFKRYCNCCGAAINNHANSIDLTKGGSGGGSGGDSGADDIAAEIGSGSGDLGGKWAFC